jgi:hypothetical protein
MNSAQQRGLRRGGAVVGRLQRQCERLARLRSEVATRDLVEFGYPRVPRADRRNHHWGSVRRAASRYWERCGRALIDGRWQVLWRAKIDHG